MKNSFLYKLFFCLILGLISPSAFSFNGNVQVLSSSASELRFIVRFDNSIGKRDSVTMLPQIVQFGVPAGASVVLTSAAGSQFTPTDMSAASSSDQLAQLLGSKSIRGRNLSAVKVNPVANGGYYQEVEIAIRFEGTARSTGALSDDDLFDRIYKHELINFDQFRQWPQPHSMAAAATEAVWPFANALDWYKIAVRQTGLVRISGSQLSSAGLTLGFDSDQLHLFNGGGKELNPNNIGEAATLEELSLYIADGGDNKFDAADYLIFYGEALKRWVYGPVDTFLTHAYDEQNIYWLAVSDQFVSSGLRMVERSVAPDNIYDLTISSFRRKVQVEQDNLLRMFSDGHITDYYTWYWSTDSELTIYASTPGLIVSDSAEIRLNGKTQPGGDSGDYMDLTINNTPGDNRFCNDQRCSYTTYALSPSGLNELKVKQYGSSASLPYFDNLNITYSSALVPVGNRLDMPLDDFVGEARFEVVNQVGGTPFLIDITEPLHPVLLTGADVGSTIDFEDISGGPDGNRYFISSTNAAGSPLSITETAPADLYAIPGQTDMIIVTSNALAGALDEYVDYRGAQGHTIRVFETEDIYDNFGFGLTDPIAIRDFLKYTYQNYPDPKPSVALFVGDGSYDFRDILETGVVNHVPPFISLIDDGYSSSDDNYVYFGTYGLLDSDTSYATGDRGYDMVTARWPSRSTAEVTNFIDKVKEYESSGSFGRWRTRVTLVADDEFGAYSNETFHVTQTEMLEQEHLPSLFERDKIYLWEYPRVNNRRPAVNDAIVRNLNEGTLLINYVGHGNPDIWAHEHVFARLEDLPRLNNYDRLSLFFSASCAIGFFDDPRREGMAEDLLAMSNGGAIGCISATRLVYSSQNHAINVAIFDRLFDGTMTTGEAVYAAKLSRQYTDPSDSVHSYPNRNDRNYLLFGDPFTRLAYPLNRIEFTESPTSLTAMQPTQVSGRIVDPNGQLLAVDGTIDIEVLDSDREKTYRLLNSSGTVIQVVNYSKNGPAIFRGTGTITAGTFDFEFIPPLDIGYGGEGAKISVYALIGDDDAAGIADSLAVADSIATFADSVGPQISYTLAGKDEFVSGDYLSNDDELVITLSDQSGINLAGGLGHGIFLEIDGHTETEENLTALFEYDENDYTTGSLSYAATDLAPGKHTFRIKAWDNANNAAETEFVGEVLAGRELAIEQLLNYPNPMQAMTTFSFRLTQAVEKLSLEIFTVAGRKIRNFNLYGLSPDYYDSIVWDGRDYAGDRVATGVYIYKASAVGSASQDKVEEFGKVVLIN